LFFVSEISLNVKKRIWKLFNSFMILQWNLSEITFKSNNMGT
jgi:hypothetical protein